MGRIRVLVADHDVLASTLLASRLRKHRQFEVTHCAVGATATIDLLRKINPAVALISASLPDDPRGGFTVLKAIQSWSPQIRAVLVLDGSEQHNIVEAFRCGAKGVFMRSAYRFETLCKCVHRVNQGQVWADSKQLGYVLEALTHTEPIPLRTTTAMQSVSRREMDVMRLVVEGLSNREVAKRLDLSEHTVKNYVFRIFDKLGLSSRVELVHYALSRQQNAESRSSIEESASASTPMAVQKTTTWAN